MSSQEKPDLTELQACCPVLTQVSTSCILAHCFLAQVDPPVAQATALVGTHYNLWHICTMLTLQVHRVQICGKEKQLPPPRFKVCTEEPSSPGREFWVGLLCVAPTKVVPSGTVGLRPLQHQQHVKQVWESWRYETPASKSCSMVLSTLLSLKDESWNHRLFLSLKIYFYWTQEIVQLVSRSLCMHEDLKIQPPGHMLKNPGVMMDAYNPSIGEAETGGSLGLDLQVAQPIQ